MKHTVPQTVFKKKYKDKKRCVLQLCAYSFKRSETGSDSQQSLIE